MLDKETLTRDSIKDGIYAIKGSMDMYHKTCYSDIGFILLGFLIGAIDRM